MVLLVFAFLLLLFWLIGDLVLCAVDRFCAGEDSSDRLWAPIVGCAAILCLSQLSSAFVPARYLAWFWWAVLAAAAVHRGLLFLRGRHSKADLAPQKAAAGRYGLLAAVLLLPALYLLWPMLRAGELFSYQFANNDIIYYLSTMDWFQAHTALETVPYSAVNPYYFCASYILRTTRFGMDALGAVVMAMLHLQAHEVFSLVGILFCSLFANTVYVLCTRLFDVKPVYSALVAVIAGMVPAWKELLIMQYVPQMGGILFLTAFITFLWDGFSHDDARSRVLASLFLSATASTYAEFSSYMFIIFAGCTGIWLAFSQERLRCLGKAVLVGVRGILFNPFGFAIAVRFNLDILGRVSESPASIDAFGGNIKSLPDVFGFAIGTPSVNVIGDGLKYKLYLCLLAVLAAILLITVVCYCAEKRKRPLPWLLLWTLLFFIGYEVYFHAVRLAYGEYKHLTSVSPILVAIFLAMVLSLPAKRLVKVGFPLLAVMLLLLNKKGRDYGYSFDTMIRYDHVLMDIRTGIDQLPEGTVLGVFGNAYHVQHELAYAAKDSDVQLMGDSYFGYAQLTAAEPVPVYLLATKDSEELEALTGGAYTTVWSNERFVIIQRDV